MAGLHHILKAQIDALEGRRQQITEAVEGRMAAVPADAAIGHKLAAGLTDAERAELDDIDAKLPGLNADYDRAIAARDAKLRQPAVEIMSAPPGQGYTAGARDTLFDRASANPTGGFATLPQFALAVRQALSPGGFVDERLRGPMASTPSSVMQEQGGTAGEGYTVPAAYRDTIWQLVFDDPLMNLVNFEPTSTNGVEFARDETTPWGATGVQAAWRAEGTIMTGSKLDTKGEMNKLYELYAFVTASNELLQDAPRMNDRLTTKAAAAITWKAIEAFMRGTGAGQPLGWMTAPALVTQTKESGQAAATIVAGNVSKMLTRMLPGSFGRAVWLANNDILPQLTTMTLGNQPIWTPPASGFQNAPGGFLFGRPLVFTEHCNTLGTVGDLQLVDLSGYYALRHTAGVEFASSIHLYFDYNLTAFRWTFRLGGQPFLSAAVSPAQGSVTKSHFVVLETRS